MRNLALLVGEAKASKAEVAKTSPEDEGRANREQGCGGKG